ncbi:hypothetical protein ACWCPJ_39005 [Streptomyces collinus]
MRTAYLEGRSIAARTHDHGVSRGAIRTTVADLLPDHTAIEEDAPGPEMSVTLDMPGTVADFLRTTELDPAERAALDCTWWTESRCCGRRNRSSPRR